MAATQAFPGGLHVGGGINTDNAMDYLDAGASHVIVTSFVFRDGMLDEERLQQLVCVPFSAVCNRMAQLLRPNADLYRATCARPWLCCSLRPRTVQTKRAVCRRCRRSASPAWFWISAAGSRTDNTGGSPEPEPSQSHRLVSWSFRPQARAGFTSGLLQRCACRVVTDRWQKFSSLPVTPETLHKLAGSCDEFLVRLSAASEAADSRGCRAPPACIISLPSGSSGSHCLEGPFNGMLRCTALMWKG